MGFTWKIGIDFSVPPIGFEKERSEQPAAILALTRQALKPLRPIGCEGILDGGRDEGGADENYGGRRIL